MAESINEVLQKAEHEMKSSLEYCKKELLKIRAGKANPTMLDGVTIDYYGSPTPIAQVATVQASDARTLTIQPYENKHIKDIEKAIQEANLGLNPQNDGTVIRANVPMLTEDRRKDLVKKAKEVTEDTKVGIRNHRRDANDNLKQLQKDGEPEDAVKGAENDVQGLTDKYTDEIDHILEHKEEEIMTV